MGLIVGQPDHWTWDHWTTGLVRTGRWTIGLGKTRLGRTGTTGLRNSESCSPLLFLHHACSSLSLWEVLGASSGKGNDGWSIRRAWWQQSVRDDHYSNGQHPCWCPSSTSCATLSHASSEKQLVSQNWKLYSSSLKSLCLNTKYELLDTYLWMHICGCKCRFM